MKWISRTEWKLIGRILVITGVFTFLGILLPVLSLKFIKGLWFGSVYSMLRVQWIVLSLHRGAQQSAGRVHAYMISQVMLRYVLTAVILFTAIQDSLISFLGAAIGVSLLKIATFLYPVHGERG